jgi:hypothetical protein
MVWILIAALWLMVMKAVIAHQHLAFIRFSEAEFSTVCSSLDSPVASKPIRFAELRWSRLFATDRKVGQVTRPGTGAAMC